MGMPTKVREAYDRGDQQALRRMREKAARTRAENNLRRKEYAASAKQRTIEETERKALDEQADAEEWYQEHQHKEQVQAAYKAARQRQDHLLPPEDQTLSF